MVRQIAFSSGVDDKIGSENIPMANNVLNNLNPEKVQYDIYQEVTEESSFHLHHVTIDVVS